MSNPIPKKWVIYPPIHIDITQQLQEYPPILRQLLYNRDINTAEKARMYLGAVFLSGYSPEMMKGIPDATDRISSAIDKGETIAIYGDYDVDGVTATALLTLVLRQLGARVQGYIPNRFDEGYGLNNEALDSLKADNVKLVITVDCGIRSLDEAEHARKIGLDLIISDHHLPTAEIPIALAVIDPKQPADDYPDKNLVGVGLAFKLVQAVLKRIYGLSVKNKETSDLDQFLDLVALGTIADMAPLVGENRLLVRKGLQYLRWPTRQGIMSLIGVSQLQPETISSESVSFVLAPRLNAAGRLDSALAALELFLTEDVTKTSFLAQLLDNQNRERQQVTKEVLLHAEQLAFANNPDQLLLFAAHESYNPGVIGLAASRLTEKYYRPAIVAQRGEEYTRGSCRSITEFNITEALDQCADLLIRHGGHATAAGFTVKNAQLTELIERMQSIAQDELIDRDIRPTYRADMEISLSDLKPDILKEIEYLQPTGPQNPPASFVSRNLKVLRSRALGNEGAHLKMTVTDGRITYEAIAFRQGYWSSNLPPRIDILYAFEKNVYNGKESLQLNVRDLKPSGVVE